MTVASLMACSSDSTSPPSGVDASTDSNVADTSTPPDSSAPDAADSAAPDSGPITIGTVTVTGWTQLAANGRIASDNAGTTYAGTESSQSVSEFPANSTTAQPGPTGLGFVTLGLSWDINGNVFAATTSNGTKYDVLYAPPNGMKFGPSAFTGNATSLYRDRGGYVYAWEQANFTVAGKLSRTPGGAAAFGALPAFPRVVSLRDVSSSADGTVFAAISDYNTNTNPTVFSLAPNAMTWTGLPPDQLIGFTAFSVAADNTGNVFTIGNGNSAGNTLKLPKGGSAWTAITGGPTKGISQGYVTNMVADGAGTAFCVGWDGSTGFLLFTLPANAAAWTSSAIAGAVYDGAIKPNPYTRLLIDAKNRLVVSIPSGVVFRSTP